MQVNWKVWRSTTLIPTPDGVPLPELYAVAPTMTSVISDAYCEPVSGLRLRSQDS
jgi:hypothetical protein